MRPRDRIKHLDVHSHEATEMSIVDANLADNWESDNGSSCSAKINNSPEAFARLKKRWEISSAVGSSLHPDKSSTDLPKPPFSSSPKTLPIIKEDLGANPSKFAFVAPNSKRELFSPQSNKPPISVQSPKSLASIIQPQACAGEESPAKSFGFEFPTASPNKHTPSDTNLKEPSIAITTKKKHAPPPPPPPPPPPANLFQIKTSSEVKKMGPAPFLIRQDSTPNVDKSSIFAKNRLTSISHVHDDMEIKRDENSDSDEVDEFLPEIIESETEDEAQMQKGSQIEFENDEKFNFELDSIGMQMELPVTPSADLIENRPVTPNTELIGTMMEELRLNRQFAEEKATSAVAKDDSGTPKSHLAPLEERDEQRLMITLSSYRKRTVNLMNKATHPSARCNFNSNSDSEDSPRERIDSIENAQSTTQTSSTVSNNDVLSATLKRLQLTIIVQQNHICQASQALSFCRQNGHREIEIDAQRALLIATERRRVLLEVYEQMQTAECVSSSPSPTATLTITGISVKLSTDFINSHKLNSLGTYHYHFIVLIRCGETLLHTTMMDDERALKTGYVEFPHRLVFANISSNFVCELDVYTLRSPDIVPEKKVGTIQKLIAFISPTEEVYDECSSRLSDKIDFRKMGHLKLDRGMISTKATGPKFLLTDVAYPLDGMITMNMKFIVDERADEQNNKRRVIYRNFLSVYQVVDGYGAWPRFWCVLEKAMLRFYRNPEDEGKKAPEFIIDLNKAQDEMCPLPPTVPSFPNSMHLDLISGIQQKNISVKFAADTGVIREHWLAAVNKAIHNAKLWTGTGMNAEHEISSTPPVI